MQERRVDPIVQMPGRENRFRKGKGFSIKELEEAGLPLNRARRLGIPIDSRRRSSHHDNVRRLKLEYMISFPLKEIKGIGKATEEELLNAGIFDIRDLAEADLERLSDETKYSKSTLKKWHVEAKKILKEKLSSL